MPPAPALDALLAPDRPALRPAGPRISSALPAGDAGAPYDRHAAVYDRLIGSPVYNRTAWGTRPQAYTDFAAEALAAGDGPFLDAGCGTLVFTAPVYRGAQRPLVLSDRSTGMLERAAVRLADAPAAFVQADLFDLPFAPGSFSTVGCFGVLHVLADPWGALAALREHVAPGGRLFASMLVSDRAIGRRYLRLLERAGEVGPPRSAAELVAAARETLGPSASVRRIGSMAYVRAPVARASSGS